MERFDLRQIEMPLCPVGTQNLRSVIEAITAASNISETRKRDMISGLHRVAHALGCSPSDTPADPQWLRARLRSVMPAALGISDKTWQNSVSNARAAMRHVGIIKRKKQPADKLSPAWATLWKSVLDSGEKSLSVGLGRFVQFLDAQNVGPEAVSDAHSQAFRELLCSEELTKDPRATWRGAVRGWNRAIACIPDWPQQKLSPPKRENVVKLPDSDLPAEFIDDLNSEMQQLKEPDLFADETPRRALRAATVKQEIRMLKRFASELILAGVPGTEITSVRSLLDPERAKLALKQMVVRKGNATHSVISDMGKLLCTWARRLEIDSTSFQRLEGVAKRVALPPQRGMTQKNRSRLRVLQDHATLRRLLELPERLFKAANKLEPKKAGLMREDAIAIALLLVCPLRIKNLAGLHVDQHFQRPGDGRVFVTLWEGEVKNETAIEFEIPADVRRMLDKHLASRTPHMCPEGTPWLFPRRDGSSAVDTSTFSTRLSLRIRKEIGVEINAHLFRHLAAMIWLNANPGAYEGARRLLGHSSVSTTINVYSGLETRAAILAYGEDLAAHRSAKK